MSYVVAESRATAPAPSNSILVRKIRSHPLVGFFILANVFSWLAWAPLAAAALGWTDRRPSPYLHLLGALGPLAAAVILTTLIEGQSGLQKLAYGCASIAGRLRWIVFAVSAPLLLFATSAAAVLAGGGDIPWREAGTTHEFPGLGPLSTSAATIVFYGFGEEVGWRGFALPRVQHGRTALTSALLVGLAWASWHIPLFVFAPGLSGMGLASVAGWFFSILTGSILMTFLFNSSGGSVMAVAFFPLVNLPVAPWLSCASLSR